MLNFPSYSNDLGVKKIFYVYDFIAGNFSTGYKNF